VPRFHRNCRRLWTAHSRYLGHTGLYRCWGFLRFPNTRRARLSFHLPEAKPAHRQWYRPPTVPYMPSCVEPVRTTVAECLPQRYEYEWWLGPVCLVWGAMRVAPWRLNVPTNTKGISMSNPQGQQGGTSLAHALEWRSARSPDHGIVDSSEQLRANEVVSEPELRSGHGNNGSSAKTHSIQIRARIIRPETGPDIL